MESVVRALVAWVRANLLLLLTLAGVVVGVILGAVLSWRLVLCASHDMNAKPL